MSNGISDKNMMTFRFPALQGKCELKAACPAAANHCRAGRFIADVRAGGETGRALLTCEYSGRDLVRSAAYFWNQRAMPRSSRAFRVAWGSFTLARKIMAAMI